MKIKSLLPLLSAVVLLFSCKKDKPLGFEEPRIFSTHTEVVVRYKSSDGTLLTGMLLLPPGDSTFPAIVCHFGSGKWTRPTYAEAFTRIWLERGVAVFGYDKRGVGESEGDCCPYGNAGYFPLLAEDVLAGFDVVKSHPKIKSGKVGFWGFSQGGWVVPVAVAKAGTDVAFSIIGGGPAVSLGEEELYSALTGEDNCTPTGTPIEDIEEQLDAAGKSGFDPRPHLEQMVCPGLWLYGGNDLSVPVERSIRILDEVRIARQKDWAWEVFPDCNHVFVINGGICQFTNGQSYDWWTPVFNWLKPILER